MGSMISKTTVTQHLFEYEQQQQQKKLKTKPKNNFQQKLIRSIMNVQQNIFDGFDFDYITHLANSILCEARKEFEFNVCAVHGLVKMNQRFKDIFYIVVQKYIT